MKRMTIYSLALTFGLASGQALAGGGHHGHHAYHDDGWRLLLQVGHDLHYAGHRHSGAYCAHRYHRGHYYGHHKGYNKGYHKGHYKGHHKPRYYGKRHFKHSDRHFYQQRNNYHGKRHYRKHRGDHHHGKVLRSGSLSPKLRSHSPRADHRDYGQRRGGSGGEQREHRRR